MSCEQYKENLALYILGDLSETDSTEVQQHLKVCRRCAEEYQEVKAMLVALDSDTPSKLSPDEKNSMRQNIMAELNQPTLSRSGVSWRIVQVAAAVLLFVGGYALGVFVNQPEAITSSQHNISLTSQVQQLTPGQLSSKRLSSQGLKLIARGLQESQR